MGNSGPDAAISQASVARLTQVEGAIATLKDGLEMVGDRESKAEGHLAAPEQAKPGEGQVIRDAFQQQSQEITAVRDLVHQFELRRRATERHCREPSPCPFRQGDAQLDG